MPQLGADALEARIFEVVRNDTIGRSDLEAPPQVLDITDIGEEPCEPATSSRSLRSRRGARWYC
jgi:hypothetical protein